MRRVLTTTDRALVESLRISLEIEGIEAVISNEGASSLPFIPISVVVDEADYHRARAVLPGLQRSSHDPVHGAAWLLQAWRVVIIAILGLAAIVGIETLLP